VSVASEVFPAGSRGLRIALIGSRGRSGGRWVRRSRGLCGVGSHIRYLYCHALLLAFFHLVVVGEERALS
jgi:hypothetical protein